MNAETRTLVRSALDASEYTRGAQQVAAANEGMASSGEAVARTTERATVALREGGGAIDRLQRSLDTTYRAQQQFERAQGTINAAMERGAISQQRATQLTTLAQQRYLGAGQAAQAFATANDNAARGSGRFGQAMGQAGFQIQDFATQVSMGQNAMVAFGVQFAQFAGIFGTAGAIAGAVVTVGILAARLLGAKDAAEELKKAQEELAAAMRTANELFETQAERAQRLEREQRTSALQGFQNAFAQQANIVAAERRALQLLLDEIRERTAANANVPGFDADRIFAARLNERRTALAAAESQFLELNRRIEETRTRTSGADRDKAEREAQQAAERAAREAEQQARANERQATRDATAAQRARDAEEREAQRARDRAEREEQQFRERQEREELQRLNRIDEANRRTTDSIVSYGADAFADMFEANGRGWQGMLDTFASTFRRLMARMAAEAIIRPIIAPIVAGLGLGGSSSGGGVGGGLGDILGLGGSINSLTGGSLSSALGLGSGGLSLTSLGVSSGLFGNGVPVLAGANGMLTGGGAASSGIVSQAGLFGGASLGATLGAAGLGFMGGSLLAGALGGNSTGGGIGGALGAGAGFLIGGPLGALIGGAAGGALGGMFGPGAPNPARHIAVGGTEDGLLSIIGAGQKHLAEEQAQALAQTEQEIRTLNALLAANKLRVGGTTQFGTDGADPNRPKTLGDALRFLDFTSSDATINRVVSGRQFGSTEELASAVQAVTQARAVYDSLVASATPASAFAAQMQAVNDNFNAAIQSAQQYGWETDKLVQAQRRATETLAAQRESGILSSALGQSRVLGDFLAGMQRGTGSAQSQFGAAQEQFAAALEVARRGGRGADLSRVTGAAQALLEANSAFNASGSAAATVEGMVRSTLANLGVSLDLPGFADNLDASINRWGEAQVDELKILVDGVAAMREELRAQNLIIRKLLAA